MMCLSGPKPLITRMAPVAMVALGTAPVSAQMMGGGGNGWRRWQGASGFARRTAIERHRKRVSTHSRRSAIRNITGHDRRAKREITDEAQYPSWHIGLEVWVRGSAVRRLPLC
jgi:hypothetical protein